MQVKSVTDALDEYFTTDDMATFDFDEIYHSEPLLSDDIWKKFGLDPLCDLSDFDEIFNDLETPPPTGEGSTECEIRNHDCMWAGHCGSKEHPADEHNKLHKTIPKMEVAPPAVIKPPAPKTQPQQQVTAGRSVLLKTITKSVPVPAAGSPDSPPISDDEDVKGQTLTLKILNDAIDEFEIDEDSDLCEYFEGDDLLTDPGEQPQVAATEAAETPPPPPPQNTPAKSYFNLNSDHCYHKDKNASMKRMVGLGIETPSDSEEEIDVVSIGEKQTFGLSRSCYLPTNPSNKDRQQLQRTMASAITNKHLPHKPSIKRMRDLSPKRRGIKRSRKVYKTTPYKKRLPISNSSDSEPEHEKRSLHNNMERQRRIDLRNAFEELRVLVPQVNNKDRAAKVVILREAASYCDYLGDVSEGMNRKLMELRRQQERLRARVSQLRRNLAAKR